MGILNQILAIQDAAGETCRLLLDAETAADRIGQKMENINKMAKTVAELLAEIDTATNAVAARIQKLVDQLGSDPSAAELATAKAGLQSEIDRLTAMGTDGQVAPDPNNP